MTKTDAVRGLRLRQRGAERPHAVLKIVDIVKFSEGPNIYFKVNFLSTILLFALCDGELHVFL